MGSSRFPGKMLREIAGKPLIWHVIHRLRQARTVAQIVLATSDQSVDDPLATYVASLGIAVVRGPEQNVLQRYLMALPLTDADIILRITGDSPLIDPELIDRLVMRLEESGADYVRASAPISDCGIDPIRRRTLERIGAERGDHPAAIEHVTGYLAVDPNFARCAELAVDGEDRLVEGARLSVDTPADLVFMQAIYRHLGAAPGDAEFQDVLRLLRAEPQLLAVNAHVRQRKADEQPLAVLIRCDGGHAIGLGHVVRCLAVAAQLRDRFSAAVTFALGGDEAALALVRAQDFPAHAVRRDAHESDLAALLRKLAPDLVLMDVRTPFSTADIAVVRAASCRLAVIDDPGPRRLEADLSFFPPAGAALDWRGAKGEHRAGFEFIPLREQFSPPPARKPAAPPRALILGGGSDPAAIGRRWLESAARALPPSWHIGMVIGAAAVDDPALAAIAQQIGDRLTLYRQVSDMAGLMAQAEIALASFGMTAYELAAIGVPMLLLCLSDEHEHAARALAERNAARIIGTIDAVGDRALDQAIIDLCADSTQRKAMSENSRRLVDGRGVERIAAELVALIHAESGSAKLGSALTR
jgi:spore coat polysaccharide biosynthesis protein SpsF